MKKFLITLTFMLPITVPILSILSVSAQAETSKIIRVAIADRPPFSYKTNGEWKGLNIDILDEYAKHYNVTLEYTEHNTVLDLLSAIDKRQADIAVGTISITSDREEKYDFTKRYFTSGLAIAVPKSTLKIDYLKTVKDSGILTTLSALLVLGVVGGIFIWIVEHNYHEDTKVHSKKSRGFRQGMWWTINVVFSSPIEVIQPKSRMGKSLALVVAIFSVFSLSIITAQFATALTTTKLRSNVQTLRDLQGRDVVVVGNANPEAFLKSKNLTPRTVERPSDLYPILKNSEADAIVHDLPLLQHQSVVDSQSNISIVGEPLNEEGYGFVLSEDQTSLREDIDATILRIQNSGELKELSKRYFHD